MRYTVAFKAPAAKDMSLVLVLSIDDRKEVYTKKGKRRWE
jgi:hypothetical protein